MKTEIFNKIKGCFYGLAIGDGLGYPHEFKTIDEIISDTARGELRFYGGDEIRVTDDTQMSIAFAKALVKSRNESFEIETLTDLIIKEYLIWAYSDENNRAPGMTCMKACDKLVKGNPWITSTILNSKGCGANMRTIPAAFLKFIEPSIHQDELANISQLQAAITHGHPTGLVASELTTITVVKLIEGIQPENLIEELRKYIETRKSFYPQDYLGDLWAQPQYRTLEEYLDIGWTENIDILDKVERKIQSNDTSINACDDIGEAWIAEEAFGVALYCFLKFPNDYEKVINTAVRTSGDTDSIACIAGGFSGAYLGYNAIPKKWSSIVEYQNDIDQILTELSL